MTSVHNRWLFALLFLCTLPCVTPRAGAQSVYAAIHGTVTDSSGAVIPGAKVTATDTSTGIFATQTTDGKGYFIFPQLALGGPYTLKIDKQGFQSFPSAGWRHRGRGAAAARSARR
jgi:hypothetical protein